MPSPFPGMDPYLEGIIWPDVHQRLATEISRRLAPRLRPGYVARLALTVFHDDPSIEGIGIVYPDVEVTRRSMGALLHELQARVVEPVATDIRVTWQPIPPAPLVVPILDAMEFHQVTIEVRDTLKNELVTAIELISPANKREPGLAEYKKKRLKLIDAGVHLLEIDLIRRGTRPIAHPGLPNSAYVVALTRRFSRKLELWPLRLQDFLPVLPVPLKDPDPDVPLELGPALAVIYDEAVYELSIDYSQKPPPPALSEEEAEWLAQIVNSELS